MSHGEGTIEIDEDTWGKFIRSLLPIKADEIEFVRFGPPKQLHDFVNVGFAWSTDGDPVEWAERAKCVSDMMAALNPPKPPPDPTELVKHMKIFAEAWENSNNGKNDKVDGMTPRDTMYAAMKVIQSELRQFE